MLLEMSDGNGLGDGWPPSACRSSCFSFLAHFPGFGVFRGKFSLCAFRHLFLTGTRFGPKCSAVVVVWLLRP